VLGLDRPSASASRASSSSALLARGHRRGERRARRVLLGLTRSTSWRCRRELDQLPCSFDETASLIPSPSTPPCPAIRGDAHPDPRDQRPAGPLALTLDAAPRARQSAGTLSENQGNGWLTLADGQITCSRTRLPALRLCGLELRDPAHLDRSNQNETGFVSSAPRRHELAPIGSAGPDDQYFLDNAASPGTFHYYAS